MSKVLVRLCRQDDLMEILALITELGEVAHGDDHPTDLKKVQQIFMEMEILPQIYLNLVAELSDHVVGFMSVIFYRTVFHKGGTALLNELIVTRKERGKGIGKSLVQRAKEEALLRGMDEIEVGTEKVNVNAQKFYHKCGFDQEYVLLGMEFD